MTTIIQGLISDFRQLDGFNEQDLHRARTIALLIERNLDGLEQKGIRFVTGCDTVMGTTCSTRPIGS